MIQLHTDRLILRNYQARDIGDLYAYMSLPDPAHERPPYTLLQCEAYVLQRLNRDDCLAVELRAAEKMIGGLTIAQGEDGIIAISPFFNILYAQEGYAQEACSALAVHLRDTLGAQISLEDQPEEGRMPFPG